MNRVYACIDLKSFYASVECMKRGLNPITTNLVVADSSRTEKTICLAVSPSLKKFGLPGRARLFEVNQKVRNINYQRAKINNFKFRGKSFNSIDLEKDKFLKLDFIIAPPKMADYIKYSTQIYSIYLKYLSSEDIYVYSIDEVFCDLTNYLKYYNMTAREIVTKILLDVLKTTGITATAGIGTNLFLAKVSMDIVAKHVDIDENGVRIAYLDEKLYREKLWNHKPLTDFWRVGKGYLKKLEKNKIYTMGDIARCSINNENLLFKLFGVNAEILIDHAWGYEPCTIDMIKNYKPKAHSLTSGQVLHCPYNFDKTRIVVREMMDLLCLDLVEKKLITDCLVLTIGYDISNMEFYNGDTVIDYYGREIPKFSHGTIKISHKTSSSNILNDKIIELYDRIVDKNLLIKRINIAVCNVISSDLKENYEQLDLFTNYESKKKEIKLEKDDVVLQNIMIDIKKKYGKNSILKAMNLEEGATTIDRNNMIGGHRA